MAAPSEEEGLSFLHPDGNGVRILALDGGDIRCFSQLLMLEELMRRLEYDHGRSIRPCEFFHSITGVGASGVIAIFLGVLGMAAENATKAFASICLKTFAEDVRTETRRSEILTKEIEGILAELKIPLDRRLQGDIDRSAGCRVSICHSSAVVFSCRMFRNYPSKHLSHNPTIIEAIRASWATPGLFSPVRVGSHPTCEELISAVNGFNNPTLEAVREAREIFGLDRSVSSFLSLGSGKRLPVSIHSEGFVQSRVLDTDDTEESCEHDLGPSGVYYRFSPEYTIQNEDLSLDSSQISSITSYTNVHLERSKTTRTLESYLKASACTSNSDLQLRPQGGTGVTNSDLGAPTSRLSPVERNILKALKVPGVHHGSPVEGCMKGTREDVLKRIDEWTTNFEAPNILWVKGHPGVGKSAIAMEIVEQLDVVHRLGSGFFFQRQNATVLTPHALWCTVAYDISRRHPTMRKIVIAKLEEEEVIPDTTNVPMLFRHFIHDPLMASMGVPTARSPVVVVDALDECGGLAGQNSTHRRHLLETLQNWSRLPRKFKLIVTSRGENDIERLFSTIRHHHIDISAGQRVGAQSSGDIRIFFTERLRQIAEQYPRSLSPSWPEPHIVNELTDRAAGLFIWAETVIKFITRGEPQQLLSLVLEGGQTGDIDGLYKQILSTIFHHPSSKNILDFKSVVGSIVFANAPLSFSSLAQLLSVNESIVEHICNALRSTLDSTEMLQFYHQSFVDFMLNKDKCPQEYLLEPHDQHRNLTLACLRTMRENLKFNICGIESSYLRNDDMVDLASRASELIPAHLLYSCRWWACHLSEIKFDATTFGLLKNFMQRQFLNWLEVLSVKRLVSLGSPMLHSLIHWISASHEDNAMAMALDMQKFVATFASVISQSVPHIYLSCLPFTPQSSTLWNQYVPTYPQTLTIRTGGLATWPSVQNLLTGHEDGVRSVTFSPDGRRIASGSYDHTIRIWDVETGQTIAGPLEGHSDSVNSVSFSPDGRRVSSGSNDMSIRIWDVEAGQTVAGPLEGHSDWVNSVSFSPDGRRLASGSYDHTIRIWDVETGCQMVAGPLKGHTLGVHSVSFSLDGRRVASGSEDRTIRIWDVETGRTVAGPLEGHSSWVSSVSFSPDGKHVASGSYDNTVRIWNVETGQTVVGPLEGHRDWVSSVSFSLDGRRVVSGSVDQTIRIWDVETGQTVAGPLEGHSDWVNSISFSPDGRRLASGSGDQAIRLWDTEANPTVAGLLDGHSSSVTSVAFSPDGRSVASGSSDNTIRVWDVKTGQRVVGPLEGHSHGVTSVSFSLDGRRIASGSHDHTIRIWDVETGQTIAGPLEGHSQSVVSVSFSPNGRRVASGSIDSTIRIWDVQTGRTITGPLEGHSSFVTSVSFSPDGTCVSSGSFDRAIRIWDVETGQTVAGPLKGHTLAVKSVSFSLDGRRVVSGSVDQTIRIWDVETGQTVAGPLEGHSGWVFSVSFSSDGRHVASGSHDHTIRIWDVETGQTIAGPLEGHSQSVASVSFSPNGRRVASGSFDSTIRIWDVQTGRTITGPLEGHSSSVASVAFPPDGRIVASGSPNSMLHELGRDIRSSNGSDLSCPLFSACSPMKDGWILGPDSELLFWVPPSLRVGFLRPENKLFIGKFVRTRLNLGYFVHGNQWTLCQSRANYDDEGISGEGPLATHASYPESIDITLSGTPPGHIPGNAKRKASQNLVDVPGVVDITRKKARLVGSSSN